MSSALKRARRHSARRDEGWARSGAAGGNLRVCVAGGLRRRGLTATLGLKGSGLLSYTHGTATGFPNSSATNWTLGSHWYKVTLHCTDLTNLATIF